MSELPPPDRDDRALGPQNIVPNPAGTPPRRDPQDDIRMRDDIDLGEDDGVNWRRDRDDRDRDEFAGERDELTGERRDLPERMAGDEMLPVPDEGIGAPSTEVPPPPSDAAFRREGAQLSRSSVPMLVGLIALGALIVALLIWRPWESDGESRSLGSQCAATAKAADAVGPLESAFHNLPAEAQGTKGKDAFLNLLRKGYTPLAQRMTELGRTVDGAKGATDEIKAQGKALVAQSETLQKEITDLVDKVSAAKSLPDVNALVNEQSLAPLRSRLALGPEFTALSTFLAADKDCAALSTQLGSLPTT